MRCSELDRAPIWDDVQTLTASQLPPIDIIFGGFPCQDISVIGAKKGLAGERSGLFYQIVRLATEAHPSFIFLENVTGIRTRGLREVIRALTDLGYDLRWTCVSAADVGALHLRKRWFLLAHSNSFRLRKEQREKFQGPGKISGPLEPNSQGTPRDPAESSAGKITPRVPRANDGLPFSVDRARALGNAVVPAQARKAFKKLIGLE